MIFVVAWWGYERRLPLIALPDTNEVVRTPQIQLQKDLSPTEFLEVGRDQRKWIREFDGVIIEDPVIDTGPQASIFLAHEEAACEASGEVEGQMNPWRASLM